MIDTFDSLHNVGGRHLARGACREDSVDKVRVRVDAGGRKRNENGGAGSGRNHLSGCLNTLRVLSRRPSVRAYTGLGPGLLMLMFLLLAEAPGCVCRRSVEIYTYLFFSRD